MKRKGAVPAQPFLSELKIQEPSASIHYRPRSSSLCNWCSILRSPRGACVDDRPKMAFFANGEKCELLENRSPQKLQKQNIFALKSAVAAQGSVHGAPNYSSHMCIVGAASAKSLRMCKGIIKNIWAKPANI